MPVDNRNFIIEDLPEDPEDSLFPEDDIDDVELQEGGDEEDGEEEGAYAQEHLRGARPAQKAENCVDRPGEQENLEEVQQVRQPTVKHVAPPARPRKR